MTAQDRPFVRVYYEIIDDPKFADVYNDDRRLATWLRLLLGADAMHPSPAPIPRATHEPTLRHLVQVGLVEPIRTDHYRVHGLRSERDNRYAGGKGRSRFPSDAHSESEYESESEPIPSRNDTRSPSRDAGDARAAPDLTSQANPDLTSPSGREVDALDTYYSLTIRFPVGRPKDWLTELANEFGHLATSKALAVEWKASSDAKTFLGRTEARLRSDAHHAEMERAKPKPRPKESPEDTARYAAQALIIREQLMTVKDA